MPIGFEDWSIIAFTSASEEEQRKANVTGTQTTITFSTEVKSWRLYNDGPSHVYYSLTPGVTTNNFKIRPRCFVMEDVPTTNIYLICDSGKTAVVYAAGLR